MMSRWVWRDVPLENTQSAGVQLIVEFSALLEVLFKFLCGFYTLLKTSTQTQLPPSHIQALVFEKPNFTGECVEVCGDLHSLCEEADEDKADTVDQKKKTLSAVGSMKILGGLWVSVGQGRRYLLHIISTPSLPTSQFNAKQKWRKVKGNTGSFCFKPEMWRTSHWQSRWWNVFPYFPLTWMTKSCAFSPHKLGGLFRDKLRGAAVRLGGGGVSTVLRLGRLWQQDSVPSARVHGQCHHQWWRQTTLGFRTAVRFFCFWILNKLQPCLRLPQEFLSPHVKLFSEPNFNSMGIKVDLMGPVVNMDQVSYSHKTQSVNVMSGV